MGTPQEPKPAKYFVALLSSEEHLRVSVEKDLTERMGPIDLASDNFPWTVSRFYEKEMGAGLRRRFLSFAPLDSPGKLADVKRQSQKVEAKHRRAGAERTGRRVNIDPGYLEAGKVVLASTKNAGHRIYLGSGIYGETALVFYDGAFRACPFTYPDYLWPETLEFFSTLRSLYLAQLKTLR